MAYNNAANLNSSGVQVISSSGSTFGRTITAGTGISVSNGDGTSGNPTVTLTGSVGSFVLIQSQTASASSTLDFTTNISTYPQIMAVLNGVYPTTTTDAIVIRFSNDGGSTYATTGGLLGNNRSTYNTTTWTNTNRVDYLVLGTTTQTSSSNSTVNGVVYIFSCGLANNPWLIGKGNYSTASTSAPAHFFGSGFGGITSVNALRFSCSNTANPFSGTITLYGLKTS